MATDTKLTTRLSVQQATLRLEGLAVLVVCVWLYARVDGAWVWWALFLAPDLSAIALIGGQRVGVAAYNTVHTYVWPLALAAIGLVGPAPLLELALIWAAHIGVDRALGYGLRYRFDSKDTTITRV